MKNLNTNLIALVILMLASCNDQSKKADSVVGTDSTQDTVKIDTSKMLGKDQIPQTLNKDQKFNVPVSKQSGDLNKDGVQDLITVRQDTVDPKNPYLLEIHLSQPNGSLNLTVSSDSAIVVPYPEGKIRKVNDAMFTGIQIKNGTFTISHELTRGSFSHQFRFQKNKFELIGYHSAGISGRDVEEVDFNLSTGNKTITRTPIGSDKITSTEISKEMIRPLPDLQFFEPYRDQY